MLLIFTMNFQSRSSCCQASAVAICHLSRLPPGEICNVAYQILKKIIKEGTKIHKAFPGFPSPCGGDNSTFQLMLFWFLP